MTLSRQIAQTVIEKGIDSDTLFATLTKYDLIALLPSIKKDIEKLSKEEGKREAIAIESPFPLDEKALARIKRIVGNDLAETEVTINKDLLAGFKARYKGKLYDGSAERIIKQLMNH